MRVCMLKVVPTVAGLMLLLCADAQAQYSQSNGQQGYGSMGQRGRNPYQSRHMHYVPQPVIIQHPANNPYSLFPRIIFYARPPTIIYQPPNDVLYQPPEIQLHYQPPLSSRYEAVRDVVMYDNFFAPSELTITAGTTVRWTNRGHHAHTTTSVKGLWDSGSRTTGEVKSYTFQEPGVYHYYCTHHPKQMRGTITVVEPGP